MSQNADSRFLQEPSLLQLQERLGHRFQRPELLRQALTHRSHHAAHNERLEFLGDAVLNLAVSDLLYSRLAHAPEGELSRARANLVRQESLHQLAVKLGLPSLLRVSVGEARTGGRERPSLLADALEALLGALYLDGGYAVARRVVERLLADVPLQPARAKDPKTSLQEWLQARKLALPHYHVTRIDGAAHAQTFAVSCSVERPAVPATEGQGPSRRAAEQAAAAAMLAQLTACPSP